MKRPVELHTITDGVHLLRRWIFNCYVLDTTLTQTDNVAVVDIGLPSYATAISTWARANGDPPLTVIPTHLHTDHIGGLPALVSAHGDVDLAVSHVADRYIAGEAPRSPGLREVAKILPVLRDEKMDLSAYREILSRGVPGFGLSGFVAPPAIDKATRLTDGAHIAGLSGWQALEVPGHTDDSLALYNESQRILCSGDAVLSIRGKAWFNPEVVDRQRQAETERRLRRLPVDVLLPGHGRPVIGSDVLARAIGFQERPPRRR